jgi:hypothetical protein
MFVEVAVLSSVLAASSQRRGEGKHVFTAHSVCESAGERYMVGPDCLGEPKVLYSQSLEAALANDFALVPDVRHVLIERADDNLLVWIALDNSTRDVREKIFQKQFEIIDGFPEVSFDFNVVAAKNRSSLDFASGAQLIYSREGR